MDQRLYLEYVPDEAGLRALRSLQATDSNAIAANELHLTLLHIGKYDAVLADLRRVKAEVTMPRLVAALARFEQAVWPLLPQQISFEPTGFELFGERARLLVLRGDASAELRAAHQAALELLKQALSECLQTDPREFMKSSHNFRHALTLVPHISLMKAVSEVPEQTLPSSLMLRLAPPSLDLKTLG